MEDFYAPASIDGGHIVFVLSVCLSVCTNNFNLAYTVIQSKGNNYTFTPHCKFIGSAEFFPFSLFLFIYPNISPPLTNYKKSHLHARSNLTSSEY